MPKRLAAWTEDSQVFALSAIDAGAYGICLAAFHPHLLVVDARRRTLLFRNWPWSFRRAVESRHIEENAACIWSAVTESCIAKHTVAGMFPAFSTAFPLLRLYPSMIKTSDIEVQQLASVDSLAPLRPAWNALARGVPFRNFDWLESWWRLYGAGPGKELFALAVFDGNRELIGLAPWYLEGSAAGRVIRFLGSGEVCSDYLTVLCRPRREEDVTQALADWLCGFTSFSGGRPAWDQIELGGVDECDVTVAWLVEQLAARGNLIHRRSRSSCWRITLPGGWDQYLNMLSKSHRKQIRRLERDYFQTGRARLVTAANESELGRGLEALIRLHQRRRQSLGERGCFASSRFVAFHEQTANRLLRSGRLRLVWLEVDGQTVAVEYQVLGDGVVYAYQSGIEPDSLEHQPGRLITLGGIKQAISEGRRAFDFLRGDESYKAHWRAKPRPALDIRVVANAPRARLRHNLWLASGNVKNWIKKGLRMSRIANQ